MYTYSNQMYTTSNDLVNVHLPKTFWSTDSSQYIDQMRMKTTYNIGVEFHIFEHALIGLVYYKLRSKLNTRLIKNHLCCMK